MIPADWTAHRRPDDREVVGWIRPEGDLWVGVDILGREVGEPGEWLDVEEALEAVGLRMLTDVWTLEGVDAVPLRVRIVEVTPDRVVVKTDDFGAIDAPSTSYELPWPAPAALRPHRDGDPDGFTIFSSGR